MPGRRLSVPAVDRGRGRPISLACHCARNGAERGDILMIIIVEERVGAGLDDDYFARGINVDVLPPDADSEEIALWIFRYPPLIAITEGPVAVRVVAGLQMRRFLVDRRRDPVCWHNLLSFARSAFQIETSETGPISQSGVQAAKCEFPPRAVGAPACVSLGSHRPPETDGQVVGHRHARSGLQHQPQRHGVRADIVVVGAGRSFTFETCKGLIHWHAHSHSTDEEHVDVGQGVVVILIKGHARGHGKCGLDRHIAVARACETRDISTNRVVDAGNVTLRRSTVEHPFGTIKAWMGSTHFLMRRLKNVRTEMALNVLAYNIKRMVALVGIKRLMAATPA